MDRIICATVGGEGGFNALPMPGVLPVVICSQVTGDEDHYLFVTQDMRLGTRRYDSLNFNMIYDFVG